MASERLAGKTMSGMYDPFANRDPWDRLADHLEMHFYMCLGAMDEAMRDPSLDDEWPEWAVG